VKKRFQKLQDTVTDFYTKEGRHDLPWRKTTSSYKIWVSEIMLQQTQVSRVKEKYTSFLKKFPSLEKLARASQAQVLKEWVGLGYNRRALFLKKGAEFVMKEYNGRLPKEVAQLETIHGIGHYTARAIATFAWDQKHIFVETNIRTVYFNHFFKNKENITDKEILNLVEQTLPDKDFRQWYWALMDLGVQLKKEGKGMNRKSKHYSKQSKFEGSDRQIRAAVVRYLTQNGDTEIDRLVQCLGFDVDRTEEQIQKQYKEGMVFIKNAILSLNK